MLFCLVTFRFLSVDLFAFWKSQGARTVVGLNLSEICTDSAAMRCWLELGEGTKTHNVQKQRSWLKQNLGTYLRRLPNVDVWHAVG